MTRQTVSANLGGDEIKDTDIKVDVSEETPTDEAPVSEPEAETTGDEEEADVNPQDIPTNNDFGVVNLEDTEEPEEQKAEPITKTEEEIRQEEREKAWTEFQDKYKPNEQKSENIRLHQQNEQLVRNLDTQQYLVVEKQNEIYRDFFKDNRDILPESSEKALLEYQKTGNEDLIANDPYLASINNELQNIVQVNPENPLQDLRQRLDKAYFNIFKDKIIDNRVKQEMVKRELESNNVSAEDGIRPQTPNQANPYSDDQKKVADAWGIKL